jgi:hypothetical protein
VPASFGAAHDAPLPAFCAGEKGRPRAFGCAIGLSGFLPRMRARQQRLFARRIPLFRLSFVRFLLHLCQPLAERSQAPFVFLDSAQVSAIRHFFHDGSLLSDNRLYAHTLSPFP